MHITKFQMFTKRVYRGAVNYATIHFKAANFGSNFSFVRTMSISKSDELVLLNIVNNKCVLTLNRVSKLNAMNYSCINSLLCKLIEWENKADMVIVKGNGQVFSSGGDIVDAVGPDEENKQRTKAFFITELLLVGLINQYPIPYIALMDGITMGGGVGISIHGSIRIATERTLIALPETKIGLFTDFGLGYAFSKMPYHLGHYLALTGHKLNGTDVVKAGIATHYTKSENIPILLKDLLELKEPRKNLNEFLLNYTENLNDIELSLKPHLNVIDKIFSATSVEEILERLQKDNSEFALKTLGILKEMCPTSLKITKRLLDIYKNASLLEGIVTENRLGANIIDSKVTPDFFEGVRAMLIDKDKKPKWNPATVQGVTDDILERAFRELPPEEELNFEIRLNELRKRMQ